MNRAWIDLDPADVHHMLISLIGFRFGEHPETRVDEIRQERRAYARKFLHMAGVSGDQTVVDLGSGCGFGTGAIAEQAGHVMRCSDGACGATWFPRVDPAIIVLVTDGERALLGRQAAWPAGRYSTLAGFVEPGESLEDTVHREVFEETGVRLAGIEYHSSQPWPFPSSLMLGFTAMAASTDIRVDDDELEDARWFSRDDITAGRVVLPPPTSVSFQLISSWFDRGGAGTLAELAGLRPWQGR